LTRRRLGRRAGVVLLAAASFFLAGLVLELAARLTRPAEGWSRADLSTYTEYDPLLGWRKRAGARARLSFPEYTYDVAINAEGLRDPERGYDNRSGVPRILLLGDSFVEGIGVASDDGVARRLEAALGARMPVEVVNGGSGGYSTDQELLFYRFEGRRYTPQVVLLFFYYNDVIGNIRDTYWRGRKPVFGVREGRLVEPEGPVSREAFLAPPPDTLDEADGGADGSALLGRVRRRLREGAPRVYAAAAGLGLWPPVKPRPAPDEMLVYETKARPEIEDAWTRTRLLLRALADDVSRDDARFGVVYVPSRLEAAERSWQLTCLRYGWEGAADRDQVRTRLKTIAQGEGFPLLDLTDALRRGDRGLLGGAYYEYDPHWNAKGHAVAAAEVQKFVLDAGWLQRRHN
jgi:lysophospholipase L1-like esterase